MFPTDLLTNIPTYFPLLSTLAGSVAASAGMDKLMSSYSGSVEMPSEEQLSQLPEAERLAQAASAAQAAQQAQSIADSLKSKAALMTDPKERERMLTEAYEREVEANGNSKKARLLSSGAFQGAAGGAGIGGAVGLGVGTVVGTLVGTVTSIPTTLLGGLVGSGVGAIHGPFIKLTGGGKKGRKEEIVQVSQEAIDSGAVIVDKKTGKVTARNPEELRRAAEAAEAAAENAEGAEKGQKKKKPRKLEVRSATPQKKQARKLEVRSGKPAQAA